MRQVYLIRHGETDWNVLGKRQGREDIPLNQRGIEQARALAQALDGFGIEAIVSSSLSRARKTAEIISESLGLAPPQIHQDWVERDFGESSGMTRAASLERWGDNTRIPGLEQMDQLMERARRALEETCGTLDLQIIAVVSRGAIMEAVLRSLCEGDEAKTLLQNASATRLSNSGRGWKIDFVNYGPEELRNLAGSPRPL